MLVDTDNNLALIGQTPASSLGKRLSIDNKEHSVRWPLAIEFRAHLTNTGGHLVIAARGQSFSLDRKQ